jgi:ankyrin repeat protein
MDNYRMTALHDAAACDDIKSIRKLLARGTVDVNVTDSKGDSAMHIAATNGHTLCIRALHELGADVNKCDRDHYSPVHLAAMHGRDECIRVLGELGADID